MMKDVHKIKKKAIAALRTPPGKDLFEFLIRYVGFFESIGSATQEQTAMFRFGQRDVVAQLFSLLNFTVDQQVGVYEKLMEIKND